ncbi:hypothetical protein GAYE_SCF64G6689 [Galdieria yellowstonensis]|uniref:Uncharacterized protein n=1 Tax=Galdieria yellowstonensis TaxID=3028027 RepID=A0AAV9IN84_9RHOD|nr:hypothetical protein GAYE_SCF64G6689 [Galdieria yellowstonensis]
MYECAWNLLKGKVILEFFRLLLSIDDATTFFASHAPIVSPPLVKLLKSSKTHPQWTSQSAECCSACSIVSFKAERFQVHGTHFF